MQNQSEKAGGPTCTSIYHCLITAQGQPLDTTRRHFSFKSVDSSGNEWIIAVKQKVFSAFVLLHLFPHPLSGDFRVIAAFLVV